MSRLKYYNTETNRWEYVDTSKIKTLYQYAVDGGFNGTEEEFGQKLSSAGHKISSITLSANNWTNVGNKTYSQSVNITNSATNSLIELQADNSILQQMMNDGVMSIVIINNNGAFTAESFGAKPTINLTIQCTLIEVDNAPNKLIGRPVTVGNSGILPVDKGGTGATTAEQARANLGAAAEGHSHDDKYYTESEVNSLLSGKSNSSHAHDDRYYTESEVNSLLSNKANSSHTHPASQITAGEFPRDMRVSYNKSDSNPLGVDNPVDDKLRNIMFSPADLTGDYGMTNGLIYLWYEE